MLDSGSVRILAAVLLFITVTGVTVLGRSLRGPRRAVVAARTPIRGSEAVWLTTTLVAQVWPLGVVLFPSWFYAWPGYSTIPVATALQVLGLVLWTLGMGVAGWAARVLGRFMTVTIQVTEGQPLVQDGPYAWVRHPIYSANVTAALGLALLFLSPPLLAVALVIAALAAYRGRLEDEFLRSPQAFGERYVAYSGRTGRFLPRLRRSGP